MKYMTEQASVLLKIARRQYNKLFKHVGTEIEGQNLSKYQTPEKVSLYISYPVDKCTKMKNGLWDIPEYSNGSTRPARCIFLIPSMAVGDACHPYITRDHSELIERYKESELYDREIILIQESFGENLVEIIWSYDFGRLSSEGQHWYSLGDFWFGIRINGQLISKESEIKDLVIPDMKQQCEYCEVVKDVSKMKMYQNISGHRIYGKWICRTEDNKPYGKCPE